MTKGPIFGFSFGILLWGWLKIIFKRPKNSYKTKNHKVKFKRPNYLIGWKTHKAENECRWTFALYFGRQKKSGFQTIRPFKEFNLLSFNENSFPFPLFLFFFWPYGFRLLCSGLSYRVHFWVGLIRKALNCVSILYLPSSFF